MEQYIPQVHLHWLTCRIPHQPQTKRVGYYLSNQNPRSRYRRRRPQYLPHLPRVSLRRRIEFFQRKRALRLGRQVSSRDIDGFMQADG